MTERFGSEYPRGRIAQTVEMQAAKDFGPEGITKNEVAHALNIKEDQISDDEWREISEFAVNAGAELIQSAVAQDIPAVLKARDVKQIQTRIERGKYEMIPSHDLFHAAETYHLTKGRSATARFAEVGKRERYTDPQAVRDELYPVLFLEIADTKMPLPVALSTPEGRKIIAGFITKAIPGDGSDSLRRVLAEESQSPEIRQRQYEAFVEYAVITNSQIKLDGQVTPEEERAMRRAIKNPPEHYTRFATRVFNQEWKRNPRLFLDELLDCIRTKPE